MGFLRKKISLYSPVKCPQKKKIQGSLAIGMAPLLFTTLCGAGGVHHACLWKKRRFLNFGFLNPGKTAVIGRALRKNTKTRFWSLDIHITHDKLTKSHSESVRTTHPANQASCFARNKRKPQETRTLSNPRINPNTIQNPRSARSAFQADVIIIIHGRVVGVAEHVEGGLSGHQVGIPPMERFRQARSDILRGGKCGDRVFGRGDVLVVLLQEHHHLRPVGVGAAPVGHEEVAEAAQVAVALRRECLVPEHLLRDWREVGERLPAGASPPGQHVLAIQLREKKEP